MTIERRCIITGEEIHECMGYCLARDILDYGAGKRNNIREISGRGMLILERRAIENGFGERTWDYLDQSGILEEKATGGN